MTYNISMCIKVYQYIGIYQYIGTFAAISTCASLGTNSGGMGILHRDVCVCVCVCHKGLVGTGCCNVDDEAVFKMMTRTNLSN
jgi:hypothetical protein